MLFTSTLPPAALVRWSRAMRHGLEAGLSPVRVLRQQASGGPNQGRTVAGQLADRLEKGSSLEDALAEHPGKFPTLFLELTALGEQTGRLTEAFGELERHYEGVVTSRKQLASALMYPAFMYFSAVGIIALLTLILGMLGLKIDPLGLGLTGATGAFAVLAVGGLVAAAAVVGTLIVRENETVRGKVEAAVLRVPVVGDCFRSFALHRFATALHMTGEAGLRMDRAMRLAFRAAANDAYGSLAESAAAGVKKGGTVAEALEPGRGQLFTDEFLDVVQVGEVSGRLPESMAQQAEALREEATRKLRLLASILGGAVYAGVALLVIVLILKLAMSTFQAGYGDALNAADNPEKWLRGQ